MKSLRLIGCTAWQLLIVLNIVVATDAARAQVGISLGTSDAIVSERNAGGDVALVGQGKAAPMVVDDHDFPGVLRAAADLQADIERVSGVKPDRLTSPPSAAPDVVIVGTLGHSRLIDQLAAKQQIRAASIAGKWESFVITTVSAPLPGASPRATSVRRTRVWYRNLSYSLAP